MIYIRSYKFFFFNFILVKRVLGPCVAAKNKPVRGTWVEALDMDGLGGPKRIIFC
jgi:hypothetical protein